jgi:phospholipase/carboxylesterase
MSTKERLSCIEIEHAPPVRASVIVLHGLGADGSDFVPMIPELKLPPTTNVRFVFPSAPVIPVTVNNGFMMRAWYDIYGFSLTAEIDNAGIENAVAAVNGLIEQEISRGIPAQNIILAGFSQGAATALITALWHQQPLGGVIALSGYLPNTHGVLQKAHHANKSTPMFIAHGKQDLILPYALGKSVYLSLHHAGYDASWHSYDMGHSVCEPELRDISQWLQKVIA